MKPFVICSMIGAILLAGADQALAADGHTNWMDLFWRLVNFVLFIGILWWAGGKKIKTFLTDRRETIARDLEELEQARAEAEQQLAALTVRIAGVGEERAGILEESRQQAEAAREKILADARRQAEEIVNQARLGAANEARRLAGQLRAELADEIVDTVQASLARRLNPAEHERLIDSALKKVVMQ